MNDDFSTHDPLTPSDVLDIVITRFLREVAPAFLDLVQERRCAARAHATLDIWIDDLGDDPALAVEPDELVRALAAIDTIVAALTREALDRRTVLADIGLSTRAEQDPYLKGVKLAERAALEARLIVEAAHPGAEAARIARGAAQIHEDEASLVARLIEDGPDALCRWAEMQPG